MKVKELIKELEKYDPEYTVDVANGGGDYWKIGWIFDEWSFREVHIVV